MSHLLIPELLHYKPRIALLKLQRKLLKENYEQPIDLIIICETILHE